MSIRDKLNGRVQPFLEPGELPRRVFLGQSINPLMIVVPGIIVASVMGSIDSLLVPLLSVVVLSSLFLVVKYRVIAVTDRAIVVLKGNPFLPTFPTGVVARLPRHTVLGPVSGLWMKVQLGNERIWVHPRFKRDVRAADADIGAGTPPSIPN